MPSKLNHKTNKLNIIKMDKLKPVLKVAGQILIVTAGVALFHFAIRPMIDKAKTMVPASDK